jgi:hypothetical protein
MQVPERLAARWPATARAIPHKTGGQLRGCPLSPTVIFENEPAKRYPDEEANNGQHLNDNQHCIGPDWVPSRHIDGKGKEMFAIIARALRKATLRLY